MPKPTIPEVAPMIMAYYKKAGNGVGGGLHIVLEDGNVKDSDVLFCRKWCEDRNDYDGIVLCDLLLQMSKTQRRKLSETGWYADA